MIQIKQNDTLPPLESQLFAPDGMEFNLDLCGVILIMSCPRKTLIKPAEIVNPHIGTVVVSWEDGDTDTPGLYKCEFKVNMPDGENITVPNDGYFYISIIDDLREG